ncbi:hypothetical protein EV378_3240 [Pseudonocardia endophytica]|uniref:Uncharacterized protein n=1 Tax=Pseudonocardia endophytica TaxID=401976 RepID=A0A4R1I492_PSEEN|nr:hypothetical protein EV378_3240 [Pseudonocardia endophytica]
MYRVEAPLPYEDLDGLALLRPENPACGSRIR